MLMEGDLQLSSSLQKPFKNFYFRACNARRDVFNSIRILAARSDIFERAL